MTTTPPADQQSSTLSRFFAFLAWVFGILLFLAVSWVLLLPLGFIGLALIVGGVLLSLLTLFHYFVWGWWLRRVLEGELAEENDERG